MTGLVWTLPAQPNQTARWEEPQAGGGSTPGAAILRGPFEFSFDTPDLLTGVTFYTPTAGDILLGGFFRVVTAWDTGDPNTRARGDFGPFSGNGGFFTVPGLLETTTKVLDRTPATDDGYERSSDGVSEVGVGVVVLTGNPLKIVVTQTGEIGGGDPGTTAGEAEFYLITATPVAF